MYCDQCGMRVEDHDRTCPSCGREFPDAARAGLVQRLERLGLLWCAMANLQIVTLALAFRFTSGLAPYSTAVIQIVAAILVSVGVASFAVGVGLHGRRSWARPVALVLAFLAALEFPVGTALGIYTVTLLLPRSVALQYRRLATLGA